MCVLQLTSASMIVYLFVTRSWSAIIGTKQPKVKSVSTIMARKINMHTSCIFLIVGNIFRLETCMNSLVKVSPYSKLNFQGKYFFPQNWCNITLRTALNFHTAPKFVFLLSITFSHDMKLKFSVTLLQEKQDELWANAHLWYPRSS